MPSSYFKKWWSKFEKVLLNQLQVCHLFVIAASAKGARKINCRCMACPPNLVGARVFCPLFCPSPKFVTIHAVSLKKVYKVPCEDLEKTLQRPFSYLSICNGKSKFVVLTHNWE